MRIAIRYLSHYSRKLSQMKITSASIKKDESDYTNISDIMSILHWKNEKENDIRYYLINILLLARVSIIYIDEQSKMIKNKLNLALCARLMNNSQLDRGFSWWQHVLDDHQQYYQ